MARVSVVIPNFNHAQFLPQRLSSVLNQTYTDFELLFLDDASTDSSLEVFEQYSGDPRVRSIINTENSGSPFKQWNLGIDNTSGEFIWIAESDDFADVELLQELVGVLESEPQVGVAYCQSRIVSTAQEEKDLYERVVRSWYKSFRDYRRWESDFINNGRDEISHYLVYKNTIPNASAVLMRRSALPDDLRTPTQMTLAGDWMFWVQMLQHSDIAYLSKPLNYFRVAHAQSQRQLTAVKGLELMEGLDVYHYINQMGLLTEKTRERALKHQVGYWAKIAYHRGMSKELKTRIFQKLVSVHPGSGENRYRNYVLPFIWAYFGAILKRYGEPPVQSVKFVYWNIRDRLT